MKNPKLTQTCKNLVSVVRQQISLVQRLRTQNELNEVMDDVRLEYWRAVQEGKSPEPMVRARLDGYMRRIVDELNFEQAKAADRAKALEAGRKSLNA